MEEKMIAMNTVNNALPVFSEINELYAAANGIHQRYNMRAAKIMSGKDDIKLKMGLLCGFAAVFVAAVSTQIFNGSFALIWFALVIGAAIYLYYRMVYNRVEGLKQQVGEEREKEEQELESISQEIMQIYQNHAAVVEGIPRDCRYYEAVAFFENVLSNGRADSMKEAVNLYEEYAHRQRVEENNARLLWESQQQQAMIASAEEASRRAANSASVAAAFSIMSFLTR